MCYNISTLGGIPLLDKGNCISVSAIGGFSFYQENDFIGRGGAGSAIKLLYNEHIYQQEKCFIHL